MTPEDGTGGGDADEGATAGGGTTDDESDRTGDDGAPHADGAGESLDTADPRGDEHSTVTRREAIAYAGGAGIGLGSFRALDNVALGYGVLTGTNLTEQDLDAYIGEHLEVHDEPVALGEYDVRVDGSEVTVEDGSGPVDRADLETDTEADAARLDEAYGLADDPVSQLFADVAAIRSEDVRFEFSKSGPFFERIRGADPRPYTVATLRGPVFERPDPEFVADFAGTHPGDAEALVGGLADGFRTHSSYDVPRYLAGSVEDNVLFGRWDLRQYFESPADFEALAAGENTGLFCTELVSRSIEAFHSQPAPEQSPPIAAGYVSNQRHKHAYTFLASAVREDGDLVVPVTFVDYTHSTLYDDLHLRWLLGEGIEAYDTRHRTTSVHWNRYAGLSP